MNLFFIKNINISDMNHLIEQMDNYINIHERNSSIRKRLSLRYDSSKLIELYKEAEDKEEFIKSLDEDDGKEILALIEGGIL
jgi:hypothetical protein